MSGEDRLEELRRAKNRAHRAMTAAMGNWLRAEKALSRAQKSFDAALLHPGRPVGQSAAVKLMRDVIGCEWRRVFSHRLAYESRQAEFQAAEQEYESYAKHLRQEEEEITDKARKAGVPELCLDAVLIRTRPDGKTKDIYFAAYGNDPTGPGHGHIVVDVYGNKLYERPILAVVGAPVNDRASRRKEAKREGRRDAQLTGDGTAA